MEFKENRSEWRYGKQPVCLLASLYLLYHSTPRRHHKQEVFQLPMTCCPFVHHHEAFLSFLYISLPFQLNFYCYNAYCYYVSGVCVLCMMACKKIGFMFSPSSVFSHLLRHQPLLPLPFARARDKTEREK